MSKSITDKWHYLSIDDIGIVVGGGTPSTRESVNFDGAIPWLTPKDLSGIHDRWIGRGARNISNKGLQDSSAKLLPQGSVLLTTRAPVGYVALAANPIATNQGFRGIIVNESNDPEFLYYWLKANTAELERHATGSTFTELSGGALKKIRVYLPKDRNEQRAIAHILGTLDDKIELNRQMSQTLESMAQTLFKSWFIDFTPVHAKAAGQDPGLPTHISALFPNHFEESQQGPIPAGWQPSRIGGAFDLTMGQSPPGESYNEAGDGLPFYQGRADFQFRFPGKRVYCTEPTRLANAGDTLVSVRVPVGDINMALEDCAIGRGVAAIRHKSDSRSYTYHFMRSLAHIFAPYKDEGTVFGSISKKDFQAIPCINPPQAVIQAYEQLCVPWDSQVELNERTSCTLSNIRDTMLPNLISGGNCRASVKNL